MPSSAQQALSGEYLCSFLPARTSPGQSGAGLFSLTALNNSYKQTFPVYGMNGVNLQDVWNNGIPEAYLAMAPEDMPNYYLFLGPNGGPGVGSTVPFLENQAAYMINCIKKIQREWIKTMVPR